jgi:glycerol-3-phosphate acyltransferase PlsX
VSLTISIDAMGGDYGPEVTIPASLDCLKNNPDLKLILVGDEAVIKQLLPQELADY